MRAATVLLIASTLALFSTAGGAAAGEVAISRDVWGTPSVFAESNYGVFFGYGYAVAQDRLYQMEMLKRTTQGRVAAVLGPDYLDLDVHIRSAYDLRSLTGQLEDLAPNEYELLKGWADGFNRRIDEVLGDREQLPVEFRHNDFLPQHWTAYDVAMIFVGAVLHRYSDFNSERDNLALLQHLRARHGDDVAQGIFDASKWLRDATSPTTAPRQSRSAEQRVAPRVNWPPATLPAAGTRRIVLDDDGAFLGTTIEPELRRKHRARLARDGFAADPGFAGASNYWAVGPAKARGAQGISVNGPQFGWSVPSYVYGIGLHGGDFNVTGSTLMAMPCLLFAHNGEVAWGSTAGLSDQVDVYVEKLHPGDPERYRHNGDWKTFDTWTEEIEVRGRESVGVTARRSVHGMVQALDAENNIAYSRSRAWEGAELQSLMAWINLARDTNLDDFQTRLASFAGNINFYYMDTSGNLGFTHGGYYPRRNESHDPRLPAPGSGTMDWLGRRPYSENPSARNPPQAYLANWNNRPGPGWPASDLWSSTWGRADRAKLLMQEIEEQPRLDPRALWHINEQVAYRDVNLPFLAPYLFAAWQDEPIPEKVREALDLLEEWNREWRPDDSGNYPAAAALAETWLRILLRRVFLDDIGAEFFHLYAATNNPVSSPGASMNTAPGVRIMIRNLDQLKSGTPPAHDFFNGTPPSQVLRETFARGVERLVEKQGPRAAEWSLPVPRMRWSPYNFRGVPQTLAKIEVTAPAYMNRGTENTLFIARDGGFRAYDVIPPGQSGNRTSQGASPHTRDQMPLFTEWRYKPVPFSRDDVDALSVSEQIIEYRR